MPTGRDVYVNVIPKYLAVFLASSNLYKKKKVLQTLCVFLFFNAMSR